MTPALQEILADGGTVITATHRLARTLRLGWDHQQAAVGMHVWPAADILPLDAWMRRSWDAALVLGTPAGARRLLAEEESRLLWRRVIARWAERGGRGVSDIAVLVPLASAGWRLCQTWHIKPAALQDAADSEDARAFAIWVSDYQRLLQDGHWLDMAGAMSAVAADVAGRLLPVPRQIGWTGFDPWPPAHAALNRALAAAGCTMAMIEAPAVRGELRVINCPDEADELVQAAVWARQRLTASPGASVAVIVPELGQRAAAVRRSFLEILAPGWQLHPPPALPLSLSGGRVLADYPVVFAALRLLQASAAVPDFELASHVLRSVYSAAAASEQAGRAALELWLRNHAPAGRISRELLIDRAQRAAPRLSAGFSTAASVFGDPRRRLLPSQWSALFTQALDAHGWPGERGLDSEEFQAAAAWQELLQTWAGCDEVGGKTSLQNALSAVETMARERPFVPEANPEGLQLLSPEEADGQRFDHLWVCGMTADRWPSATHPHSLVPLKLQRAAGIPAAAPATLQAWTERRFSRLLAGADELVLSWANRCNDAELLISPLLQRCGAVTEAVATTVDPYPDRSVVAGSAQPVAVPLDPPPVWPAGQQLRGGARVLSLQAVCPARAFIEARLHGMELRRPARPLDPSMRGNLLHKLLEQLYRQAECRQGLNALPAARLSALFAELIDGVLDHCLPRPDAFLRRLRELERERLWSQLMALVTLEQAWGSFSVETEIPHPTTLGALKLDLRLDRIDTFANGMRLVIDYKTGTFKPKSWRGARMTDCQLPLYAISTGCDGVAVLQFTPATVLVHGVGDPALGLSCLKTPQKYFEDPVPDWASTVARWRDQLERFAAEFAAGDFRIDPAATAQATGQYAVLTGIHAGLEETE